VVEGVGEAAVIEVHLSWGEVYRAGEAALQRSVANLKKKREDAHGAEQDGGLGLDKHWMGCLGEMAVAKHFNVYWHATEFGAIDVGGVFEVRATDADYKRLWAHDDDPDDLRFILVHAVPKKLPIVTLAGWMQGRDIKRRDWYGECNPAKPNGRPAYWVPNSALLTMDDLIAEVVF